MTWKPNKSPLCLWRGWWLWQSPPSPTSEGFFQREPTDLDIWKVKPQIKPSKGNFIGTTWQYVTHFTHSIKKQKPQLHLTDWCMLNRKKNSIFDIAKHVILLHFALGHILVMLIFPYHVSCIMPFHQICASKFCVKTATPLVPIKSWSGNYNTFAIMLQ